MVKVINFYLDDSGTRRPDHDPGKRAAHGYDWFALGGVMVKQEDEVTAKGLYADFLGAWPQIKGPLHSVEIRGRTEAFLWLNDLSEEDREVFLESLYQLMRTVPVVGLACVINRPGYNARYFHKYGRQPWSLCKTAFAVAIERAAKHAREAGYKLRVLPEKCNKPEDALLGEYYDALRKEGMPFAADTSEKYKGLSADQFSDTLYEFRPKAKSSSMAQFADLYLWPICMGGYNKGNRTYRRLMDDGKLIECQLSEDEWPLRATKYSCFDDTP